ncbi:hypothetical protein G7054_g11913 [Neopestalotiopsis clavispora]|nr:hypothetical protein G7054_g11913 [Neopestalotiopsis clavispora]
MSAPLNAAPARGGSGQMNNHDHSGSFSTAQRPAYNTQSRVPSKRSDDDIQFISSQPVKKQKVAQTKLKIKVTNSSTTGPSYHAIQPQQQHQSPFQHSDQLPNQMSPYAVPEIQLTPAPVVALAGNGGQQQNKTNAYAQDRRISTGMVGLPSDFHDTEAADAMRGVSLPLAACLDSFVLNQPASRPRPMSSPPLSPKQLCPTTPFSMLDATMSSPDVVNHHNSSQEASHMPRNPSIRPQSAFQMPPASHHHHQHTVFINQTMTPINSPSPGSLKNMDIAMSSTPLPASPSVTESCEQPPDRTKQTPPITLPRPTTTPTTTPVISHPHGAKAPCQACIAQSHRAMMPRPQVLPTPMMGMSKMTSHAMPQIPCPPMHSYLPSPQQYMAMSPYNPAFHPMMMPMHPHGFQGTLQHHGGLPFHPQILNSAQTQPEPSSSPPQTPISAKRDEMRQTAPSSPTTLPAAPISPAKSHPTPSTKHRKPARNLIVDIAETCHERFPFEDVAKRHHATVAEVKEVYDAIIGVPLLVSASDRRRAGELARSRKAEYRSTKKDILKEREAGRGPTDSAKDDTVVSAMDIALKLGASNVPDNR